jgi:competence ComEA-like helix-hairpin-helix protein
MPITEKQLEGIIGLIVLALIICFSIGYYTSYQNLEYPIHHRDKNSGQARVEIAGDSRFNGIYFVPEKIKVSELFKIAGIGDTGTMNKNIQNSQISTGKMIEIKTDGQINIGEMSNAKRLILDMPVNINKATSMDLVLIPGIGRKTAEHIISFRRTNGSLQRLEDLMRIPGIKDKKFAKLRRFFCIDC